MIFALERLAATANSCFRLGFYGDICFGALSCYSFNGLGQEIVVKTSSADGLGYLASQIRIFSMGNSRGVRALILVQNIVTNVPRVLLRARRRHMRCGNGGVNMRISQRHQLRSRSCGFAVLQRVINRKLVPCTSKNVYYQTPDRPPHGAATRTLYFIFT